MDTTSSAARIQAIRDRLAGISPTPWEHVGYFNAMRHIAGCGQTDDNVPHYVVRREGSYLKPNGARADAEFIAHAPEDTTYLLGMFSREDVGELRAVAEHVRQEGYPGLNDADAARFESLAARISSLLPPEQP